MSIAKENWKISIIPYELQEVYRGWQIWGAPEYTSYYAMKGEIKSPTMAMRASVKSWIDLEEAGSGTSDEANLFFSPDLHNWVGYLEAADTARENKFVALGPAPPGLAGRLEGVLLVVALARFSKTPEGMRILNNWGIQYLKAIQVIINGLATSSSANPLNCLFNGYLSVRIYQRLGLISAHDAVQTAAWFDHCFAELLKKSWFDSGIGGLTTLVNATSVTGGKAPSWEGLAALGKILGGK